jgi:hypothetical protein
MKMECKGSKPFVCSLIEHPKFKSENCSISRYIRCLAYKFPILKKFGHVNLSAIQLSFGLHITNTVLEFLELGANLQATLDDNKRATALHLPSRYGHLLIVEALIQSGAHVNAQAYKGIIPLHGAVAGRGSADAHTCGCAHIKSCDLPHIQISVKIIGLVSGMNTLNWLRCSVHNIEIEFNTQSTVINVSSPLLIYTALL